MATTESTSRINDTHTTPDVSKDKNAKREKFLGVFTKIRAEMDEAFRANNMPEEACEWFLRCFDYNVPGGKLNRGLSVVDTAEIILNRPLTDDEYFRSAILGWGIELLQAYFLVSDDMMDASITRRGQPCWYRVAGVGQIAINDSFLLKSAIYYLVRKHFRNEKYYVHLVELFLETTFQTELGQLVDLITAPEDADITKFTLDRHKYIVIYKTAFYSFYLPVALAMRFCGIEDEKLYDHAKSILIPLGEMFQVQDDYLDCFGTPEQIGKIGTDIVDNKCSWNINMAMLHVSEEQRQILLENYGKKSPVAEQKVKEVFYAVDLPGKYAKYEEKTYQEICGLVENLPEGSINKQVFYSFVHKIYKRTK
jgi:farnesyl diphosphate synthase